MEMPRPRARSPVVPDNSALGLTQLLGEALNPPITKSGAESVSFTDGNDGANGSSGSTKEQLEVHPLQFPLQ